LGRRRKQTGHKDLRRQAQSCSLRRARRPATPTKRNFSARLGRAEIQVSCQRTFLRGRCELSELRDQIQQEVLRKLVGTLWGVLRAMVDLLGGLRERLADISGTPSRRNGRKICEPVGFERRIGADDRRSLARPSANICDSYGFESFAMVDCKRPWVFARMRLRVRRFILCCAGAETAPACLGF
jgi:hypothetical protein